MKRLTVRRFTIGALIVALIGGVGFWLAFSRNNPPSAPDSRASSATGSRALITSTDFTWEVTSGGSADDLRGMERAVRSVITEHPLPHKPDETVSFEGVSVDGDWALTGPVVREMQSQSLRPYEAIIILLHRENGSWRAAYPGTDDFHVWLEMLPPSLLSEESKALFR